MFFAPTLLALTSPHLHNDVRVLCLSSGNADGIGALRTGELVKSCEELGVVEGARGSSCWVEGAEGERKGQGKLELGRVVVVEHPQLQDGMGIFWPTQVIASVLRRVLKQWGTQEAEAGGNVGKGDHQLGEWLPHLLITFDSSGISGHSNHISALSGAKEYTHSLTTETKPRLYTLTSISILRKYASILDFPLTYITSKSGNGHQWVFVNTLEQFQRARRAMTHAHKSQMRWFRWGWIWASRYMVLNHLAEEVHDAGLHEDKRGGEEEL